MPPTIFNAIALSFFSTQKEKINSVKKQLNSHVFIEHPSDSFHREQQAVKFNGPKRPSQHSHKGSSHRHGHRSNDSTEKQIVDLRGATTPPPMETGSSYYPYYPANSTMSPPIETTYSTNPPSSGVGDSGVEQMQPTIPADHTRRFFLQPSFIVMQNNEPIVFDTAYHNPTPPPVREVTEQDNINWKKTIEEINKIINDHQVPLLGVTHKEDGNEATFLFDTDHDYFKDPDDLGVRSVTHPTVNLEYLNKTGLLPGYDPNHVQTEISKTGYKKETWIAPKDQSKDQVEQTETPTDPKELRRNQLYNYYLNYYLEQKIPNPENSAKEATNEQMVKEFGEEAAIKYSMAPAEGNKSSSGTLQYPARITSKDKNKKERTFTLVNPRLGIYKDYKDTQEQYRYDRTTGVLKLLSKKEKEKLREQIKKYASQNR